jgi:mono/diheme cytochrome c family protein
MKYSGKKGYRVQALGWAALALLPVVTALWSEAAVQGPGAGGRGPGASRQKTVAGQPPAGKGSQRSTLNAQRSTPRLAYNRDVRPILAENCFACHGPDSAARKADLRLDRLADATAMRNGRAAIVKGKPAASELVKRITGDGPLMPPRSSHKALTPEQIETLKRWVTEGAEYEPHWSFIPPKRPALPAVKDTRWVRNPIDRFVLARLEQAGLRPAPEADRRTLARRLSLDLTGLPPDPADVEAFVADKSPDVYEKLVDKFLSSPQWGEHRARYWLDAARYGDTHGIHFDNFRETWAYRDWVIGAFNRNLPFDQFTIEQLAGDLLPNPTLDQLVATGFNRCNITTNEGGVIPEEYLVLYTRDRTEATSQVWMGATTGCAVCHDHKFDPISQKEFYELAAFFNNTTQGAMDGNIKDTPPVLPVPLAEDRERFQVLKGELESARKQVEARKQAARADFDRWLAGADTKAAAATIPSEGLRFHAPLAEGQGRSIEATLEGKPLTLTAAADPAWEPGQVAASAFRRQAGSVVEVPQAGDFEKDQAFSFAAWVKLANATGGGAVVARMDDQSDFRGWDLWVENGRVGTHIVHKWPEDAVKVVTRDPLKAGQWHHVCVTYTGAGNAASVRVFIDGVAKDTNVQSNTLKGTIRTQVPLKIGQRHTTSGLDGAGIQDLRLYGRALSAQEVERLARGTRAAWLASRGIMQLSAPEKDELFAWWLPGLDEPYRTVAGKLAVLESEDRAIRMRGTVAHVMVEKAEPPTAYILFRGEYDKRRDQVKADTPDALPPMPADLPRNRLGFAKWLLLPEHPLTTRVTVNRIWQEVFGEGLVRTSGDFGVTGEQPSHPELLDWLAVEFREGVGSTERPWDIKAFFRLIVTSATYRQAAVITPEKRQKDPKNRLLSRGPRFRMDAEVIRDYALAASGLLVRKLGGPSVKPYQPEGVWEAVAMIGSNTRDYKRDTGENLYRRSMYTFWKRSAPPASLEVFNAPNRETCVVRRERTNTPLQALVTLNDIQFVEAARHLAQSALKEGGTTADTQVDFIARRLLSRPLRPEEQAVVRKSLAELEGFYRSRGKEARELIAVGESKADPSLEPERLAAWTMLVNQLMNLDEVLNK